MPVSRRVSYILPSPNEAPPLLHLPGLGERRRGVTQPFLSPRAAAQPNANGHAPDGVAAADPFASPPPEQSNHPRHCLGINALALDTTTVLADSSSPGGILYSGGRDGLVVSWELGVPHKQRETRRYDLPAGKSRTKWERIGDSAEIWDEEDEEEDGYDFNGSPTNGTTSQMNNGDDDDDDLSSDDEPEGGWGVDGGRMAEGMKKRKAGKGEIPYEDRWQVDQDALHEHDPPSAKYRQSAQTHTDWVNAMLLCNLNQTVITGSADRTIRAWSPHSANSSPALIGRHRDYVRSLAWAKYPSLLFSGALDRQIAIWDVTQPDPEKPLLELDLNKADDWGGVGLEGGERGSIYALGTDPAGKILAAGTPERVVRLWDPRVGDNAIGKLVGHSDCVRSIVVSEDGRYMLTGSSDTTIKLWSLGEHRCLHTFNHHTSSVWALQSSHPRLERFYSGSRDGILCAVDVEAVTDISEGECVVLAREGETGQKGDYETKSGDEGIRSIAGMDDTYVYTATGSAEIKRWRDVGRRIDRLSHEDGVSYIPPDRSVQHNAPAPIFDAISHAHDVGASEPLLRTDSQDSRAVAFAPAPAADRPTGISQMGRAGMSRTSLNSSLVEESTTLNEIPFDSLVSLGLADSPYSFAFGNRSDELAVNGDAKPSEMASNRGSMEIMRENQPRARQEYQDRDVASEAVPLRKSPDDVIHGRPGLVRSILLNDRQHVLSVDTSGQVAAWNILRGTCVGRFESADVSAALELERGIKVENAGRKHSVEVLELVRDRIEGETMVITWCQVDTKIGSLVVHLEEGRVFDAEVYADEVGVNAKDDVRLNLGKWALANLFKGLIKAEESSVLSMSPTTTTSSLSGRKSPDARPIPIERPQAAPIHRQRAATGSFSGGRPHLEIPGTATSATTPAVLPDLDHLSRSAPTAGGAWQSFQSGLGAIPGSPPSTTGLSPMDTMARDDYFSMRKRDQSPSGAEEKVVATPSVAPTPGTTPGGSKKMFKGFGKKKKDNTPMATVQETKEAAAEPEPEKPKFTEREQEQLSILDVVRAHSFHPPSTLEAPPIEFPASTSLLISEESKDAGAWVVTCRSQVSSTERDMETLEMNAPLWLLNYLFTSRSKAKDPVKLTFILEPVPGSGMKEMPEGTTRLSASRILRARKIISFIYDKLDLGSARRAGLLAAGKKLSALAKGQSDKQDKQATIVESDQPLKPDDVSTLPEETIELLCGDHVVNPRMTLATLKQYYGVGGDMLLHYRMKKAEPAT